MVHGYGSEISAMKTLSTLGVCVLLAGCGGVQSSPVAPTVIRETVFVGPPASPAPPPGPHFALELAALSSGAVRAGEAWHGLVTVTANPAIVRPALPTGVSVACGRETKAFPGFSSGTASFSCVLEEGTHAVTARAQMADGLVYATGLAVTILAAPPPPPPPPAPDPPAPPRQPRPTPTPAPTVTLEALELWKGTTEATWRFWVDVENGTLEDAEFDAGPGSNCIGGSCTIEDEDDYLDVRYTIAGNKDVRVAATVNGETVRARKTIAVTFAP
jgi:hypothetical protein